MFRVSNVLITILNTITLIISIVAIGYSLWFSVHDGSLCQRVIQKPLLFTGLFLMAVSLLGLIGACCRVQLILYLYLAVMFLSIVALICFTIFAVVVTNKGVGNVVSGKGYKEYRLGDYSHWLQKYVINAKNWEHIKSCLIDVRVCGSLDLHPMAADFYEKELPVLQSGCCKPPASCGFAFKNATYWETPKSGPAVPDNDCKTWSNDQKKLCFDCNSCKAGVLSNIQKQWKELAFINFFIILVIILIYSIGCCAARNNKADRFTRLHKPYP
ncbi:hypothetical protein LguiB_007645 [Lonicera macranthoides]